MNLEPRDDFEAELPKDFTPEPLDKGDEDEVQIWKSFKSNPNPQDFEKLWKKNEWAVMKGIQYHTDVSNPLPEGALYAKGLQWFDNSLKKWNPDMGVKLSSYVFGQMRAAARYVRENRDIGHIPDNRLVHVHRYRLANEKLTDKLGREPSTEEISTEMNLPYKMVKKLRGELRKDLIQQGHHLATPEIDIGKFEDIIHGFYNDLNPKQQVILERTYGMFGKKTKKPEDIAKELGIPAAKVYYERGKLANMMKDRYGERIN